MAADEELLCGALLKRNHASRSGVRGCFEERFSRVGWPTGIGKRRAQTLRPCANVRAVCREVDRVAIERRGAFERERRVGFLCRPPCADRGVVQVTGAMMML